MAMMDGYYEWEITLDVQASFVSSNWKNTWENDEVTRKDV